MRDAHARLERDLAALEELSVFVAYNANVDAIVRVAEELASFLDRPSDPGKTGPAKPLESKRDLAAAIARTMAAGHGDEIAMTDAFAATLEAELKPDGQAGIMTNLLTALGTAPITYTYLLSERQLSMFDHPEAVRYPVLEDETVSYVSLPEAETAERTKINWVFEFREGDEFFGVRATGGSRFIAASRPPEFDLTAGDLETPRGRDWRRSNCSQNTSAGESMTAPSVSRRSPPAPTASSPIPRGQSVSATSSRPRVSSSSSPSPGTRVRGDRGPDQSRFDEPPQPAVMETYSPTPTSRRR